MAQVPIKEFTKPKVFLVEGKDEEAVIVAIAERSGRNDIEARDVGGKNQFKKKFPPAIKQASFSSVNCLGIIQDANGDPNAAFQRVSRMLADHRLPCPAAPGGFASGGNLRVGVLILPGAGQQGYLEDLFLTAYSGSPELSCVDAFASCCGAIRPLTTKERAHALLVAIGAPETRLGRAFESKHINADGPAYTVLRDFVLNL